jgi:LCP family protein required for cell wall assembly
VIRRVLITRRALAASLRIEAARLCVKVASLRAAATGIWTIATVLMVALTPGTPQRGRRTSTNTRTRPGTETGTETETGTRTRTRTRTGTRTRTWRWVAIGVTGGLVAGCLTAYAVYARLDGNLSVVNAFGGLKDRPPASARGVENILLLGSQTRDGQGPGFGYDPGTDLSDNLILVHLDQTHTHATVVSIPRDLLVYEPQCRSRKGGGTIPAIPEAIIDGAMNQGGPSCAVATVEHLTGIRVTHFIRLDFNSFRTMTDILGGVEVCLPQAVDDPFSHLRLAAGRHLVTGSEALAFVRTRHGVGDGGDLGRIELQQEFMSSLVQKLESEGTLDNPVKMLQIADSATRALTVDPGLGSVSKLLDLAYSLRSVHTKNVTFVTIPSVPDPTDVNRLLLVYPQDDIIWQMLKTGQLWHGHLPLPPVRTVRVRVLNGTGESGLAASSAAALRKSGFDVTGTGDAPQAPATSVSYVGTAGAGGAYALSSALTQAPAAADTMLTQPPSAGTSVSGMVSTPASAPATSSLSGTPSVSITLTLGGDYAGVRPPRPPSSPPPARSKNPRTPGSPPYLAPGAAAVPGAAAPAVSGAPAVQSRNAAASICSGVPGANPNP